MKAASFVGVVAALGALGACSAILGVGDLQGTGGGGGAGGKASSSTTSTSSSGSTSTSGSSSSTSTTGSGGASSSASASTSSSAGGATSSGGGSSSASSSASSTAASSTAASSAASSTAASTAAASSSSSSSGCIDANCPVCQKCTPQGGCDYAGAGTDPKNECFVGGCKTGTCDGAGHCGVLEPFVPCSNGCGAANFMKWGLCDASGNCMQEPDYSCPQACSFNGCACSSSFDCPSPAVYMCGPMNYCIPRGDLGAPCTQGQQCLSNNCEMINTHVCVQGTETATMPCTLNQQCASNNCAGANPPPGMPGMCQ